MCEYVCACITTARCITNEEYRLGMYRINFGKINYGVLKARKKLLIKPSINNGDKHRWYKNGCELEEIK